jgi:hypothetical protein
MKANHIFIIDLNWKNRIKFEGKRNLLKVFMFQLLKIWCVNVPRVNPIDETVPKGEITFVFNWLLFSF